MIVEASQDFHQALPIILTGGQEFSQRNPEAAPGIYVGRTGILFFKAAATDVDSIERHLNSATHNQHQAMHLDWLCLATTLSPSVLSTASEM